MENEEHEIMNVYKFVLHIVLLFAFSLPIISCKDDATTFTPYEKLSDEKFIKIYIELKTVEIHLKKKTTSHHVYREWVEKASDSIFNKYDTEPEIFYDAYDHYMKTPIKLFQLFESALDTVNLRKRTTLD